MSAIAAPSLNRLPDDLAALIPDDAPELVGVGWIADLLGITPQTVTHAIRAGKLPALSIPGAATTIAYAVRPEDAVRIWGRRVLRRRAAA
ncbi:MAG: hypothetical protein KDB26_10455 [Microthrixaceae bacterium]|nr:hypothetical protein [Microthrixaceae bacterium]